MTQLFDEFGVLITADNVQFRQAFQESSTALDNFKKKVGEAGAASRRASDHLGTTGNRAKKYGTEVARARQHTANLAAQFNDIGVMMAAGQNPFIMAMQQGTQINQVFQAMGNNVRDVGKSMGAALTSIISPMSLLTIGTIAGAAAVVQWGLAWLQAGKQAEDALGGIEKHQLEYAQKIADTLIAQKQVSIAQKELNTETEEQARLMQAIAALELKIADMTRKRGLMHEAAWRTGYEAEFNGLQKTLQALRDKLDTINTLIAKDDQLTEELDKQQQFQEEINKLLGNDLSELDRLIQKTEIWADRTKAVANNLAEVFNRGIRFTQQGAAAGRGRGLSSGGPNAGPGSTMVQEMRRLEENFRIGERKRLEREAARKGGGGKANSLQTQLESLEKALMSEEELERASYDRRRETLRNALEQNLLTREEHYNLVEELNKKHSEKMAEIDVWRYGTATQQLASGLGVMADVFAAGNEKMQKVAQVFGAGEALINAWRAYSQVLADPSVPFWGKFAAAASVLTAGMRAVTAIKGLSGGGASGAAVGAVSGGAGGAVGGGSSGGGTYYTVNLQGEGAISQNSVRQFLSMINEEIENGATIKGINLA